MNSTVAMVGTASKGISYLSGDAEYIRKRELRQQRSKAQRNTNILEGLAEGGGSVFSGFKSGKLTTLIGTLTIYIKPIMYIIYIACCPQALLG